MTRMTLRECEEKAKNEGYDSATFDICGPLGRAKAKWLDAYFGLFVIEGQDGFNTVKQAEECGLWAENFNPQSTSAANSKAGGEHG